MASRMLWSKGVREFVEAAQKLRQESVAGRFVLVGDTDPDNPDGISRRQLAEWHDTGAVEWWGYRSDMPSVLASSHVVCLPTMYGEGVLDAFLETPRRRRTQAREVLSEFAQRLLGLAVVRHAPRGVEPLSDHAVVLAWQIRDNVSLLVNIMPISA